MYPQLIKMEEGLTQIAKAKNHVEKSEIELLREHVNGFAKSSEGHPLKYLRMFNWRGKEGIAKAAMETEDAGVF